jgi:purine-nucleoside phosphorylase
MNPDQFPSVEEIDSLANRIRESTELRPKVGMILGSGLGSLADSLESSTSLATDELPGWPISTVEGHAGRLVIGMLEGIPVCVLQGRVHYYEGYSIARIGLPIRVLQRLGAELLIVTNAAGGVNPAFEPGDVMLINDHINLIGMAGLSPLRGPNLQEFGPRFPDMSQAYDRQLQTLARQVAAQEGIVLREGVYICLGGPAFETPADLRFLRLIGVDAVGMSTVPEIIVARHGGMRTLGFSGISNKVSLDGEKLTTHQEVLEAGRRVGPKLERLIRGVLRRL